MRALRVDAFRGDAGGDAHRGNAQGDDRRVGWSDPALPGGSDSTPVTVLHIITGLNTGGAETMLAKLVGHPAARRRGLRQEVLSLLVPGTVSERIRAAGIPIHTLGMKRALPGIGSLARLAAIVRRVQPAILQGWMHHGNLAASVAARLQPGRPAVLWNVRHSLADIDVEPRGVRAILRLQARTSHRPRAIIYNSRVAAAQYAAIGFDAGRQAIIPNGFDCTAFAPDPAARGRLRTIFGIGSGAVVVGMVARNHPMKSVDNLIAATALARKAGHDLHLLLVGNGMDSATLMASPATAAALAQLPADRMTLSGERADVAHWLPGLDVVALPSSWGEAFPNIIGEAMACGVPCVTTDVGDAGWVVGRTGLVVPPGDIAALAHALGQLARLGASGRRMLGLAARTRAIAEFSLESIAERYAGLYAGEAAQAYHRATGRR
ncbi:glycosyltransferase [Sandarakinorhabdus glacialis]|nr:glycosyltransferase [Polymorphobacter glacialis]